MTILETVLQETITGKKVMPPKIGFNLKRLDKKYRKNRKKIKFKKINGQKLTFSNQYKRYLQNKWWRSRRKEYWKNYDMICFCCHHKARDIHHITYKNIGREKDKDLIPVCRFCHLEIHKLIKQNNCVNLSNAHIFLEALLKTNSRHLKQPF